MSSLDATWEDVDKMKLDFQNFNLEDKVVVNGGGIDVNKAIGDEGIEGMSVGDSESLTRDQEKDSSVESKKLSWKVQGHVEKVVGTIERSSRLYGKIKRPIRNLD